MDSCSAELSRCFCPRAVCEHGGKKGAVVGEDPAGQVPPVAAEARQAHGQGQ